MTKERPTLVVKSRHLSHPLKGRKCSADLVFCYRTSVVGHVPSLPPLMTVLIKIGDLLNRLLRLVQPKGAGFRFLLSEWFPSVWHSHRWISPSLHQHIEYAVLTVPRHDHWPIDGAVHQIFIGRHGQSGFQIPFTARRDMTIDAVRSKDGLNVVPEADLPFLLHTAANSRTTTIITPASIRFVMLTGRVY